MSVFRCSLIVSLVSLAFLGCGDSNEGGDDVADTSAPVDTVDSVDTAEPPDTSDTAEPIDTSDTAEPPETIDTTDTADTAEPPDTTDSADTPDQEVIEPPDDLGLRFALAGTIQITETFSGGAGEVVGSWIYLDLRDGPTPASYEAHAEEGSCKVWTRSEAACDPPCDFGQLCTLDGDCVADPPRVSAGDITFGGLVEPIIARPGELGTYTLEPDPPLGGLFEAGADITVAAAGDRIGPFTASVAGVADLHIQGVGLVELRDDQPTTVTWTPAGDGSTVELVLQLGWHGAPPTGVIVCRAPDVAGEIVVPPAVIAPFPYFTFGLFQVPSWIERVSRTLVSTAGGPIEITASSRVNLGVTHEP